MNNLLPHYRRERKIKQTDMARALSVSPSYLCKVEKGLIEPTERFRSDCSVYLDVPAAVLFPENGTSRPGHARLDKDSAPARGNLLWMVRTEKGMKQYELARLLSCSPSFLSKIEKGLQTPGVDFRKKCARILKVKESVLFP